MTGAVLALAVGALFAAGCYMILRPNLLKVVVGLALMTNGTTLLILLSGDLVPGGAPLVPAGANFVSGVSDPLPQALVLTAIVISFGVQAFLLALVHEAGLEVGSLDPDLAEDEPLDPPRDPAPPEGDPP